MKLTCTQLELLDIKITYNYSFLFLKRHIKTFRKGTYKRTFFCHKSLLFPGLWFPRLFVQRKFPLLMGLANSAIVDYEDAQRRCVYRASWDPHHAGTTRELERWSRSFQRFKDKSGFMDKATFTKFVLANSAPPELADSLYRVFSNDQQGISWRDFVCNLVVLLKVVTWWPTH